MDKLNPWLVVAVGIALFLFFVGFALLISSMSFSGSMFEDCILVQDGNVSIVSETVQIENLGNAQIYICVGQGQ